MKQCTWCGKEYPDDTTVCTIDGQPLKHIGHMPPPSPEPTASPAETIIEETTPDGKPVLTTHDIALRNIRVGALWCGGGILVTALTYSAASGPGGGSYIVAWGAILFGGLRFFRGVAAINQPAQRLDSQPLGSNDIAYTPPELVSKPAKPGVWICSKCGEPSEPQFTVCWKCQTPRDSTAMIEKPATEI